VVFLRSETAARQHAQLLRTPHRLNAPDHKTRGRLLVLRYAGVQMACAAVVAVGALALQGPGSGLRAAGSALAGGTIVALGNVVFGWRMFSPGIAPAGALARAWYVGEVLKWLWVGFALWAALGPAQLPPLPLLLGLVAAQIGFWIGVAAVKTG
jgi:ATP synthase protein I